MSLPPYQQFKESGVEWLGKVPCHWDVKPNKAVLELRKSEVGSSCATKCLLSLTLKGVIPRDVESGKGKYPSDFGTYQDVARDDLIFCLFDIDETPRTVGIAETEGMITGAYDVFRCKNGALPRFILYYYLHIDSFKGLRPFYTGLRKVVRPATFMAVKMLLPPLSEQKLIVTFLDREITKIDCLVAEQQRLIELLKEKRQAVISHAVTKGLNSNAPMKPSGIEWLGDIPKHWEVIRIKRLCSVISKGTTPTTVGADFTTEGIRFLKAENITESGVVDQPEFYISKASHAILSRSSLQADDVLVVIAGATTGKSAVLSEALLPANTNQAVSFVRPIDKSVSPYLNLWLGTRLIRNLILLNSVQSAQPNLSMEDLGNIPLPLPPSKELNEIIVRLDTALSRCDRLINEGRLAIDLLEERRSALISAAVTGQIDVRSAMERQAA